jgi:hypothetical protein
MNRLRHLPTVAAVTPTSNAIFCEDAPIDQARAIAKTIDRLWVTSFKGYILLFRTHSCTLSDFSMEAIKEVFAYL